MAIATGSIFPRNGVPPSQAAPGADATARATCNELFYKSTCNPRFDPQAMNSIMSELLNTVNHSCDGTDSGPDWNCASQTNLLNAICRLSEEKFWELIVSCLDVEFPDFGQTCGTADYLVLSTDSEGCRRIATYNPATAPGGFGTWGDIAAHLTPNTTGYTLPNDFANPVNYYDVASLLADDNDGAGVIDEARVLNSRLGRVEVNVPCSGTYTVTVAFEIAPSASADEAYDRRANLYYRWRAVGSSTWTYARVGSGTLAFFASMNGINRTESFTADIPITVMMDDVEIEVFYTAPQSGGANEPVIIAANTYLTGSGFVGAPRITVRRRL